MTEAGQPTIRVRDQGPIRSLDIPLPPGGGVLVLTGRNGCGKTSGVNAVSRALGGSEAVSKREGALEGSVELEGIKVMLGKQVRVSGESEIAALSLAGGEQLRLFVDPGLKDPALADSARIKAALGLARITARPEDWEDAVGGPAVLASLTAESDLRTSDPVELASRVKRAAEAAARVQETEVARLGVEIETRVRANASVQIEGVLHDAPALAAQHESVVKLLGQMEEQHRARALLLTQATEAHEKLAAHDTGESVEAASEALDGAVSATAFAEGVVQRLRAELQMAEAEVKRREDAAAFASRALSAARSHALAMAGWRSTVEQAASVAPVPEEELMRLRVSVEEARDAMEAGAAVRAALKRAAEVEALRAIRDKREAEALRLRAAAAAAEGVLTKLFASKGASGLEVRNGRLIAHEGERTVWFAELSHGQRYKHAIDLATSGCGAGGLIPLDQVGWEGLDPDNRALVYEAARARGVTIITAEAASGDLRVDAFAPPPSAP